MSVIYNLQNFWLQILIRLALVTFFLACIAGAILGTFFLTRSLG